MIFLALLFLVFLDIRMRKLYVMSQYWSHARQGAVCQAVGWGKFLFHCQPQLSGWVVLFGMGVFEQNNDGARK